MNHLVRRHPTRQCARWVVVVLAGVVVAACGSDGTAPVASDSVPALVVGVGTLPSADMQPLTIPPTPSTFPSGSSIPVRQLTVGEVADGPRLLMIGDSIFASISRRFYNNACEGLVPLGWQVSVEAERGRFIDLGVKILDAKLDDGWDAAAVFLGTNYGVNQEVYEQYLDEILDRLAPRPTIIFTTTEYRVEQREVNEVIEKEVLSRDNLWLVDWRSISQAPGVLWRDGIHPTTAGNELMVDILEETLGRAPGDEPGECLKSEFKNDTPLNTVPSGGGSTVPGDNSTTVPDSATTTDPSVTSSTPPETSVPSGSSTSVPASTNVPSSSVAPNTVSPGTMFPGTAAPTTLSST